MNVSRDFAAVLGPLLIALAVTEPLHLNIFAEPLPRFVYLNGMILLASGLFIVRFHNLWIWSWPVLITLSGWSLLLGGLSRMVFPQAPQLVALGPGTLAMFALMLIIGLVLTWNAYLATRR